MKNNIKNLAIVAALLYSMLALKAIAEFNPGRCVWFPSKYIGIRICTKD